jgi:Uma2 family endonuclease
MALKAISTAAIPLRQWPAPGEWTYQDYLDLPDDGNRYEVIWGELYMMTPAPSTLHQRTSRNLGFALWRYVQEHNLGEVLLAPCDLVMEPGATPVQPDLLFIAQDCLDIITEKNVRGTPNLIVEILSSSNPEHDRERKFHLYEQSSVAEYWIVDPGVRSIEVFVLRQGAYSLLERFGPGEEATSQVLRGFSVAVDDVIPIEHPD